MIRSLNSPFVCLCGVLLLLGIAGPLARAQAPTSLQRFERQLEQIRRETTLQVDRSVPVDQRLLLDYGGFLQFGYLSLDDSRNDNHVLRQYELTGYVRANLDGAQEVFLRGVMGYRDFNDRDSFDGRGDEPIDPDLDRGYYRFDLRRYNAAYRGKADEDFNLVFQGGRDLVYWANGLVMSVPIDGIITDLSWGKFTLEVIAGVTPTRTVDFDFTRPSFDHNTRRGFYGAILSAQLGVHRPYVYALAQRDYNGDNTRVVNGQTVRFKYDSYYLGVGSTGGLTDRLAYGVEAVFEGGKTYSSNFADVDGQTTSVEQSKDQIRAWAADVRLDYVLGDHRKTRLSAEGIFASGDPDRVNTSGTVGGNRPGTDDHAFNAFGLINTGLAFAPEVSNLLALRVGAATFPAPDVSAFERMQVGTDFFVFAKLRSDAPINEPTTDDRYLGVEPDFFVNWQFTNDLSLAVRYGVFFPGSGVVASGEVRQFFFAGLTYAF
jgi:Alginate export